MTLFKRPEKVIPDLCEFSKLFFDVITGIGLDVIIDENKIEKWGTSVAAYSHSYGRKLQYELSTGGKIKFHAGLALKDSTVVGFFVQFKQIPSPPKTEFLDNENFSRFCEKQDIKILQKFIEEKLSKYIT
jgi:hypothetical protein